MARQLGLTTRQLLKAEKGALYVWPNEHCGYVKTLARDLGRMDLEIRGPSILDPWNIRGRRWSQIILDHATRLTEEQDFELTNYRRRYETKQTR